MSEMYKLYINLTDELGTQIGMRGAKTRRQNSFIDCTSLTATACATATNKHTGTDPNRQEYRVRIKVSYFTMNYS